MLVQVEHVNDIVKGANSLSLDLVRSEWRKDKNPDTSITWMLWFLKDNHMMAFSGFNQVANWMYILENMDVEHDWWIKMQEELPVDETKVMLSPPRF